MQRARLTHHGCDLRRGFGEHPDFILTEYTGVDGLDHQDTLQDATVNKRDAQKRLVRIFAGFAKVLEARMVFHLLHCHRTHLLRNQPGQAFVQREA